MVQPTPAGSPATIAAPKYHSHLAAPATKVEPVSPPRPTALSMSTSGSAAKEQEWRPTRSAGPVSGYVPG